MQAMPWMACSATYVFDRTRLGAPGEDRWCIMNSGAAAVLGWLGPGPVGVLATAALPPPAGAAHPAGDAVADAMVDDRGATLCDEPSLWIPDALPADRMPLDCGVVAATPDCGVVPAADPAEGGGGAHTAPPPPPPPPPPPL